MQLWLVNLLVAGWNVGLWYSHILEFIRCARTSLAETKYTLSRAVFSSATLSSRTRNSMSVLICCWRTSSISSGSCAEASQRLLRINIFGLESRALTQWKKFFSYKQQLWSNSTQQRHEMQTHSSHQSRLSIRHKYKNISIKTMLSDPVINIGIHINTRTRRNINQTAIMIMFLSPIYKFNIFLKKRTLSLRPEHTY